MIRLAILSGTVSLALIVAWQLGYFELSRREHLIAIIRRAEGTAWAAPLYVTSYTLVVALCPQPHSPSSAERSSEPQGGLMLARTGATIGTIAAHTLARSIGKGALPPRQAQVASQTPRSRGRSNAHSSPRSSAGTVRGTRLCRRPSWGITADLAARDRDRNRAWDRGVHICWRPIPSGSRSTRHRRSSPAGHRQPRHNHGDWNRARVLAHR